MRLEGRRSSRNLPTGLSEGVVVAAPANGDCFFALVCMGIREKAVSTSDLESSIPVEAEAEDENSLADPDSLTNYCKISSLRALVANEYSEDIFQLMVSAGQIPSTARCIPTFNDFKVRLKHERAFADEHCIGIICAKLKIAFLMLDDNIGGRPTMYWNSNKSSILPKYFMTLRLGREHYSGIKFKGRLLHDSESLHPQIRQFWKQQLKDLRLDDWH